MAGAGRRALGGDRQHDHANSHRKERQQRKDETSQRSDPWLDQFGVGSFRKESNRLITLYSHGKKDEAAKTPRKGSSAAKRSRMVNLTKILNVVQKMPWERRADEVELVREAQAVHAQAVHATHPMTNPKRFSMPVKVCA